MSSSIKKIFGRLRQSNASWAGTYDKRLKDSSYYTHQTELSQNSPLAQLSFDLGKYVSNYLSKHARIQKKRLSDNQHALLLNTKNELQKLSKSTILGSDEIFTQLQGILGELQEQFDVAKMPTSKFASNLLKIEPTLLAAKERQLQIEKNVLSDQRNYHKIVSSNLVSSNKADVHAKTGSYRVFEQVKALIKKEAKAMVIHADNSTKEFFEQLVASIDDVSPGALKDTYADVRSEITDKLGLEAANKFHSTVEQEMIGDEKMGLGFGTENLESLDRLAQQDPEYTKGKPSLSM